MDGDTFKRSDLLQAFTTAVARDSSGKSLTAADEEEFLDFLDDPSLSKEQKQQIIQALWPIIQTFVEFGFGSHPVQLACGQLTKDLEPYDQTDSDRESVKIADQYDNDEDAPDQR
ncbi:MAG: hypothetical protein ACJAXK_001298 [Yoonia sp.]|jgi:hypothetical protein